MLLLAIPGSLRAASTNRILLRAAARLVPDGTVVELYGGLGGLPLFDPDLDTDEPPVAVAALRKAVGAADGLLISAPEYAHGIAGPMKNALDWLVRSTEFPFKPVALFNASPRATHALGHMREVLVTMSARIVEAASITVPLGGRQVDTDGLLADPYLADPLRTALARLVEDIRSFNGQAGDGILNKA